MPSLKHVKRRITSVRSTKQITKAMDLVAASKLYRFKPLLAHARDLYSGAREAIADAASFPEAGASLCAAGKRPVTDTAYIVISSDRGLCGGYNSSVAKLALAHMKENRADEQIIAIGARGANFLLRQGKNVTKDRYAMPVPPSYEQAQKVAARVLNDYMSGLYGEVYIVYTQFINTVTYEPEVVKLLPIDTAPESAPLRSPVGEVLYEPSPATFLDSAVPTYLEMLIYGALVEAAICEQAARAVSMNAATKNAQEIIEKLTLSYNQARQSIITQEITEIVSGANALQ